MRVVNIILFGFWNWEKEMKESEGESTVLGIILLLSCIGAGMSCVCVW